MNQMNLPSSGMANFLLFFFHAPLAVLLPCHSTMSCPSLFQSLLKFSFSAHFRWRLYQFLGMHVTYKVYVQMPTLHTLSNYMLYLSFRGFNAFSWKSNFSLQLKKNNSNYFLPFIGNDIKTWTFPVQFHLISSHATPLPSVLVLPLHSKSLF